MKHRGVAGGLIVLALMMLGGCGLWPSKRPTEPAALALEKGDHVCIIGGGFADRMQHHGYLEAMIHAKYPEQELTIRNLAFAGDEVKTRMRSEGFGSPDEWLTKFKADVVLAFFGYNESWKGREGLEEFRKDLDEFIKETLKQKYNGKSAPRLVLFTPTVAERHIDLNFPDPKPINENIAIYSAAMKEIAKTNGIPCIDLESISDGVFSARRLEAKRGSLTINGVHLNEKGYAALAPAMYEGILGSRAPSMKGKTFNELLAAVNAKNETWFGRYRTVDGYNVYGGRSHLKFDDITNRDTMQREMEIRDVMTENADAKIWAVAQGKDIAAVAKKTPPPPITVKTNKPGKGEGGKHLFLNGEEAIAKMKLPPGCNVTLFAAEDQFPELGNPVQMAFDTKGRLWVAAWPNYPERTPDSKKGDSLLVFEDTDGDFKADKVTPFVDDLNCPTGFQFYKDGVILVQAPDVWFLRDTDGDGRADWKERILNGLDSADSHHTANSLVLDPGGAIYLSDGVFHRTQMETPWGPPVRNQDAAIYRFEPRTGKIETYISYGFANPHGRVFDYWGNDLVTDATGNNTYFGPAFSGKIDFPKKHAELRQFWERPMRPCPGTAILSSRHFPEEFQNQFLNINVIGFQGVYRVDVRAEDSGLWGKTINPPLVQSDDPNFRPIAMDVAPDGSIYFLDWHNPIIGHMQHHIRDPNRDHLHGRIYRMTFEGRPLLPVAKIAGEPIEKLLELLKTPENNVRTRAKIELGARKTSDVIAALEPWLKSFDPTKIEDQHHLLEGLWVYQWMNVVNESHLLAMLKSPDQRARAAAVRVLGYWRDRVKEPLALLRAAANDPSLRVRLEAVRVLSFFEGTEPMEIAYDILKYPTDYYLDYTFKETTRQLSKSASVLFLPKDPVALKATVARLSDQDLLNVADAEAVLIERVARPGLNVNVRTASVNSLVALHKSDGISEQVSILKRILAEKRVRSAAEEIGFLITTYPKADLAKSREEFSAFAAQNENPAVRRAGFAALVAADGSLEPTWKSTEGDPAARTELLRSLGLHGDVEFRSTFASMLDDAVKDVQTRDAAILALPLLGRDRAKTNFEVIARHLKNGDSRPAAARAIMQLPRESWSAKSAKPAAEAILAYMKNVPGADRTSTDNVQIMQAGMELAGILAPADAAKIRKGLLDLGVRVFALRSVREQMRYDVTRLVVQADKPFEIAFENDDMMPHNLTVLAPGSREAIGALSDAMQPVPDGQGRTFVPNDKRVLAATKMIEPGTRAVLKMTAPKTVGTYEYVCTYPEHWKTMFGELVVVEDLEAYFKSAPPAPTTTSSPTSHLHK